MALPSGYQQLLAELRPTLEELDGMRMDALLKIAVWTAAFCTFWGLLWVCLVTFHVVELFDKNILSLIFIPMLIAGAFFYLHFTRDLRRAFKEKVIRRFVALIDESFEYNPHGRIDPMDYRASGIFKKPYDRYKGDDYVTGRMGDTRLSFSELHTTYTTGSGKRRRTVTIFHGLFAVADFHKNFAGTTYVLPDKAESTLGWLGQQLQSANQSHGELIRLEDPEFEKTFVVYGTDQIEARYILSTSLMQRMVRFRQKAGIDVSFAFRNSKLYVAIHHNRALFEPGLWGSYLDSGALDPYLDDLQLIMGVVADLNLNLNIWNPARRKVV